MVDNKVPNIIALLDGILNRFTIKEMFHNRPTGNTSISMSASPWFVSINTFHFNLPIVFDDDIVVYIFDNRFFNRRHF